MRKEYLMDDSMKKTIKDISEIITGEDKVKSKVADYIKGMKSKIEMKLFIVFLYRRLNDMLRKFIEEIKKTENEEELSPSFFSILLIDSFFEKKEKIFLRDIISDISHQLKTPLSSLKVFNELLLNNLVENTDDKYYAENTHRVWPKQRSIKL